MFKTRLLRRSAVVAATLAIVISGFVTTAPYASAAQGRLRMHHSVDCNNYLGEYSIRWTIREHLPGSVAKLAHSSRNGRWHGQWDWVHHYVTYRPTLWMEEWLPGSTVGTIQLAVRIVWRDFLTGRVRDRGTFRDSVSLAGECGLEPPPSPTPSPTPPPAGTELSVMGWPRCSVGASGKWNVVVMRIALGNWT
jgi:hypothetical protein